MKGMGSIPTLGKPIFYLKWMYDEYLHLLLHVYIQRTELYQKMSLLVFTCSTRSSAMEHMALNIHIGLAELLGKRLSLMVYLIGCSPGL